MVFQIIKKLPRWPNQYIISSATADEKSKIGQQSEASQRPNHQPRAEEDSSGLWKIRSHNDYFTLWGEANLLIWLSTLLSRRWPGPREYHAASMDPGLFPLLWHFPQGETLKLPGTDWRKYIWVWGPGGEGCEREANSLLGLKGILRHENHFSNDK